MNRLFADTFFFFFAFPNADDGAHREASTFYDAFNGQLVTTEWVLTELADGLSGRSNRQAFVDFHRALRNDPTVTKYLGSWTIRLIDLNGVFVAHSPLGFSERYPMVAKPPFARIASITASLWFIDYRL